MSVDSTVQTVTSRLSQSETEEIEDGSADDSDEEWEGIEEEISISAQTTCLFCSEIFNNAELVFDHCRSQHMFDIVGYCSKMRFNCIAYIKFINYVRFHKTTSSQLVDIPKEIWPWAGDEYMKPFDVSDPLLIFDIESYVLDKLAERGDSEEMITLPRSEFEGILQKLASMEMKLENAFDRIDRMRDAARTVLFQNNHCSSNNQGASSSESRGEDESDFYFSTYDHFAIHHEMLQDKVRTASYQEAILKNPHIFKGKNVLDLGCGTAILSMFAAEAGAAKVFAVDMSDVIYQAMDIVRENDFDSVIELLKGRVEDVLIPDEKVDIIVSEWMGYFLLFEGMLDSVIFARDRYLTEGGLMFPDRCTLSLAAVCDLEKYEEYIGFWDNVYGYKMSVMKRDVIREANVEIVKGDVLCSQPVVVKELDILTCSASDADFRQEFELTMDRSCTVTAIVGYFETFFERELSHKVVLSTSPKETTTHWKHSLFLLPEQVQVAEGEKVPCKVSCRKNRRDPRSLVVRLTFGKCSNKYYLS